MATWTDYVDNMKDAPDQPADLGLPAGVRVSSLTVSEPAECLVVTVAPLDGEAEQVRLFVRGFHAARYQEVPWPNGCNSFRVPIASPTAPLLYVLGMHWQESEGNCVGVYRVTLPGLATGLAVPAHSVSAAVGERSWVSQLLGFAADGHRILVVRASGTDSFGYSVCALNPEDGAVEPLANLPAVFA